MSDGDGNHGKKKLSGAQSRKRKLEKEVSLKRNTRSIEKFIVRPGPSSEGRLDETYETEEESTREFNSSTSLVPPPPPPSPPPLPSLSSVVAEAEEDENPPSAEASPGNILREEVINDLALWPQVLSDKQRLFLMERGPVQVKESSYPANSSKRSFSNAYYTKKMLNKETVLRDWLVYSKSTDSVYCFYCKLFDADSTPFNGETGYKDWQHLSTAIDRHEKSLGHLTCLKNQINLKTVILKKTCIDLLHQNEIERERKRWVAVLERIINIVQFLARQCLAFRGKNEKLFEENNGNFLKLIECTSNFDNVLAEHIALIQKSEARLPHYLGHNIQNEIIELLGERIKKTIVLELKNSKYYSIILDCTPDTAHVEQISVVVRYVLLNVGNTTGPTAEIKEHFLGFFPITDTTGQGLTEFLLSCLNLNEIDIQDMRGQGYDNGANMKGKNIGLQKRILDLNPRAFYVPCAAHSLNLVVNDAAKSSLEIVNFFSIVQEIYVFFSASTARWQMLANEMPTLSLKPLSNTRWESRVEAVKALRFNLGKVYDALFAIYSDRNKDPESRNMANSLMTKIKSFKFICSVLIWYAILSKINIVSKALQKSDVMLSEAVKMIKNAKINLSELRSDTSFREFINSTKTVAEEVEAIAEFPEPTRPRARKRFFNYEAHDEPITDPETHFKVNFYYYLLDTAITKCEERFDLLHQNNETFSFLQNLQHWSDLDIDTKNAHCSNLENKLCHAGSSDLDKFELFNEIELLPMFIDDSTTPLDILNYLYTNNLIPVFPNLSTALRIYLTLPVTVAYSERSFSKLKIIKNYLRSTLSQSRLTNLSIISIEHEVKIETSDIIKDFANAKARKVSFL